MAQEHKRFLGLFGSGREVLLAAGGNWSVFRADVSGHETFGAVNQFETHPRTFFEAFEAVHFNG